MGLENITKDSTILDLDPSWPLNTDTIKQGDNHIQNIKQVLHNEVGRNFGVSNPNLLVNGGFQVWQRGTSFKAAEGLGEYAADLFWAQKSEQGTVTVRRAKGDVPVSGIVDTLQWLNENGAEIDLRYCKELEIEGNSPVPRKDLVLSLDLYIAGGGAYSLEVGYGTTPATLTQSLKVQHGIAGASWERVEIAFRATSPTAAAKCLILRLSGSDAAHIQTGNWKLEESDVATPYTWAEFPATLEFCRATYREQFVLEQTPGEHTHAAVDVESMRRLPTMKVLEVYTGVLLPTLLSRNTSRPYGAFVQGAQPEGSPAGINAMVSFDCSL